ncbi:UPF0193 protein EVG1 homolog [Halyomorpha halys]|uniref:UPF0193 protein EVG1 homolog n=1 Tax=Halyomorpha halys TaxID=286706 RepID=UPI0006D4E38A|nr:UPF0193 protein EVG1 homolog [Halyomorpha halys]
MGDRLATVSQGGLFHSHKVNYSPETEAFLRELIRESKLSIFQRKEVEKSIKNGQPLPLPPRKTAPSNNKKITPLGELKVKYMIPRRRKLNSIQKSGAFERDTFVPTYAKANHETEKKKLQEIMSFGRTLKSGKIYKKPSFITDDEVSTYEESDITMKESFLQEMMEEIDERRKFLERMESLGKGKKYKDIIEQEIVGKYNLIEKMNEMFKGLNPKK